ncbi:MAG: phenylalanine--tRNA ligase subunit beta [Acidobacteriota bacterium]|nr:phenylalanine--tRNA ligase subunit beta [Acidobacteriota bacterium]
MKILTSWLRSAVPDIAVDDQQLAQDLTLRGIAVEGVHSLGPDGHLFEMDITTNRVDAMNHYGIAREAATIYDLPLAPHSTALPAATPAAPFPVRIEAPELCGRFTARVLRNVTIAPSTGMVAHYFNLLGQKLISNAVDASNFTLLGMGHPTHAFDLDKIEGGIVVRLARRGEKLRLLDGTERTLEADDLVVADEKKALALAGVMGGWDSMITAETKHILVEAAWFDPASIRRSSRRHLLHTDASHRFERGADFNAAPVANDLVSRLILQSGGTIEGELVDVVVPSVQARTAQRPPIALSVQQVQRHLGTTVHPEGITREIVAQYLSALGCTLTEQTPDSFAVQLPSWRLDLEREIDLVEEIARVYGYNRFANTLPTPGVVVAHATAAREAAVRTRLLALGYSESISSTFASQQDAELFGTPGQGSIALENPLSEEASLLRPSLLPGMAAMLAHNLNRDVKQVRLFEQGQAFTGTTQCVVETPQLALGLTGPVVASTLYSAQDAPIFELKGVLESLLSLFATESVAFTAAAPAWAEPGRGATVLVNGQALASFGELASAQQAARKLRQPVYLAQLDLGALYQLSLRHITARELSRYQAVERDFSFVFPEAVAWGAAEQAILGLGVAELQTLRPVEVWRDHKKFPGVYSLLVRAVFQSQERTLREDELAAWQAQIVNALTALGGTQRA